MARYWIRNRGRVQGPFSEERIQGLLRRGRFSRHFHVSEDRRNWYPAAEFPELFEGVGGPEPVDEDEGPFPSGGSPFDGDYDEDDAPPAQLPTSERKRRRSRRPVEEDEYEDDEDDDSEDDRDDEDDDWEDDDEDYEGLIPGIVGWIERNVVAVLVVLVLVLGVLSWLFFMKEDFTQDIADMETLMGVQSSIMQAHQRGTPANEWIAILESTEDELAPMITRLDDSASAQDMVKQELLFLARDDLPRMIKELPKGQQDAANRVRIRLKLVDDMIQQQIRWHDGSALMVTPVSPALPTGNTAGESNAEGMPAENPGGSNMPTNSGGQPPTGSSNTNQPAPPNGNAVGSPQTNSAGSGSPANGFQPQ